jgi:hypothetical protein
MSIYVASRVHHASMWRNYRLIKDICSSWIDQAGPGESDFEELWFRTIPQEIAASRCLLLYVEPADFPLKGALVEVGMAMAMGKPIVVCAPEVQLEPRSFRPIGSWMSAPTVVREDVLIRALDLASTERWI